MTVPTTNDERRTAGALIVFEGLDQSGKQTQAELLRDRLKQEGHKARVYWDSVVTVVGGRLGRAPAKIELFRSFVMRTVTGLISESTAGCHPVRA